MIQNELIKKRVIIEVGSGVVFAGELLDIIDVNGEDGYLVQTDASANVCVWSSCKNTRRIEKVPIKG
jgi:hypothetical protein